MDTSEFEKSTVHAIPDIAEQKPNLIITRHIIKKLTGNICFFSLAAGKKLSKETSPFDIYIQIIHGAAALTINKKLHQLHFGEGIIIPARSTYSFAAHECFKMISTVIKSQYEE